MGPLADFRIPKDKTAKVNMLKWVDEVEQGKSIKRNDSLKDLLKKETVEKIQNHRERSEVKGTLRDRGLTIQDITGVKDFGKAKAIEEEKPADRPSATPELFYRKGDTDLEDALETENSQQAKSKEMKHASVADTDEEQIIFDKKAKTPIDTDTVNSSLQKTKNPDIEDSNTSLIK